MKHTLDGHHILSVKPDISEGVKLAALQHHERMDGSGFPFNSSGKDIHEYARIAHQTSRDFGQLPLRHREIADGGGEI